MGLLEPCGAVGTYNTRKGSFINDVRTELALQTEVGGVTPRSDVIREVAYSKLGTRVTQPEEGSEKSQICCLDILDVFPQ